ncbi:Cys-tRNA(Pro) deacylase [Desulforhopalus singaporensis]|uniref:Cys-tRNA(Pro)/Cys-tRNA(Cys) deacylase n=1 Tax=Desulforhopalus singaporensis TaxID=91360 RepID=A0A1H0J4U9_9BACT|nr:Cys-tRNA(Pro) deacylase [Desulforhopalus singaporensis]SDO38533.1 Cys-tRNA(Pro)/Cys-tRNA(Cys) deacylase [Desulforhopalus singaporensis]
MTPAINILRKKKIPYKIHEYDHDPASSSYGMEAAEKLGVKEQRVFKTLVVGLGDGGDMAVGIIPVACKLNLKQMAKAAGAKKAFMAPRQDVERATGYILGGVSPLGQKRRLKMYLDSSAKNFPTIFISGGRRGLDVELAPTDLASVTGALFSELCR